MTSKSLTQKLFNSLLSIAFIVGGLGLCANAEAGDTTRSEAKVKQFLEKPVKFSRKVQQTTRTFEAPPEEVFPLLCPTTEYDWLPGWEAELIQTSTGYAEQDAVFRTSHFIPGEVWICSRYEPPSLIEYIRFSEHLVIKIHMTLKADHAGTTTHTATMTYTALTEQGNAIIAEMPDEAGHHGGADPLGYYLKTGEMLEVPAAE